MVTKKWFATIICAAIIFAGVTTVSALGNLYGDCLMDQNRDGTGDDCPGNTLSISVASGNMKGDCLMEQDQDGTGDNCQDICG